MEEPERRVGGVIEPVLVAFRKEIRDQPLVQMLRAFSPAARARAVSAVRVAGLMTN
jgi:hypothetical protein